MPPVAVHEQPSAGGVPEASARSAGFLCARIFSQARRDVFGPPNSGLSLQFLHVPQLASVDRKAYLPPRSNDASRAASSAASRRSAEVRASFAQYNQGPSPIPRRYILYPGNPPPERMLRGPLRVVPGGTWHVDPSELANRAGGRAILKKISSHSRALKPENRASLVAQHDHMHNALDQ